jgi:hypothetical protein
MLRFTPDSAGRLRSARPAMLGLPEHAEAATPACAGRARISAVRRDTSAVA